MYQVRVVKGTRGTSPNCMLGPDIVNPYVDSLVRQHVCKGG